MSDLILRSAPFGRGTSTPRQLVDGSTAVSFSLNLMLTLGSQQADLIGVQIKAAALNLAPGRLYDLDGVGSDSRYVIARVQWEHGVAQDSALNSLVWYATAFIEPDPTKLVADLNVQASHYQETVYNDVATNNPIVNAAGDPFFPALEENKGRMRLEITKRFLVQGGVTPDYWTQAIYHKNTNDVSFTYLGAAFQYNAQQMYCTDVRSPVRWEPLPHYEVTMGFEIDPGFTNPTSGSKTYWQRHPINQGYNYKGSDGQRHACQSSGVHNGFCSPLAADGSQLAIGQTPIVMDVSTIPLFDFSKLGIFP